MKSLTRRECINIMQFEVHCSQHLVLARSLDESGHWPRSNKQEVLSLPYFILSNYLPAVNKQVAERYSKVLFKRHLQNFNCLGAFIIKFTKQIFKFSKPCLYSSLKFTRTVLRKYRVPSHPLCPHPSTPSYY